jgi:hypothetical protein
MSLRDWFAGHALAGLVAQDSEADCPPEILSEEAYELADAMLAEKARREADNA